MDGDNWSKPLFLEWVKEWWDIERERNSKGAPTYKKAYNSLKVCPLTFRHPAELDALHGFGPKICQRLTDKFKRHCEDNGLPMPPHPKGKRKREMESALVEAAVAQNEQPSPPKRAKKARPYVPKLNSGAYALLMALSDPGPSGYMDKTALIVKAQPYSDTSFTVPSMANKSYTAWDSMKTLDDKELVHIRGRPTKRYSLTDEGWEVVKRMKEARNLVDGVGEKTATSSRTATASGSGTSNVNRNDENFNPNRPESGVKRESRYTPLDTKRFGSATISPEKPPQARPRTVTTEIISLDSDEEDLRYNFDEEEDRKPAIIREPATNREYIDLVADGDTIPSDESSLPHFTPIRLAPGSFTVELVLDTREVQAKNNRDYIQDELSKLGIRPIMRSLELGDVLWVAKCKQLGWLNRLGAEGDEVVLDYIVERKRLDDLTGSIKDGRFREQKYRLKRSGMKNVIYVVENFSLDQEVRNKYQEAMDTAMASVQVVNGYFLKKTDTIAESIKYLASVTYMLKEIYEAKPLFVIPTNVLTAKNYLPLIKHLREKEPSKGHYISYPAFASLVSKSEMMTLGDVFLKMLMCIRRLSGEKAIEIRKVWKTPYELVRAFEACGTDENGKRKQKALVMSMLSHVVGRGSVDNGLSEKIAEVWGFL